jgi:hypothetical protein
MSPQQDVSVRNLLAAGPAVKAICTPPAADANEPEREDASGEEERERRPVEGERDEPAR